MAYTDGTPAPTLFRLWSAIACVGGALERRVWCETSRSPMYPNMFVLLVSGPGVGKSVAIHPVSEIWLTAGKFYISPNSVTKAALVDCLLAADRKIITPQGVTEYHSLLVPCSEFGVLLPAHDLEFLSVMNDIYDNPRVYREQRRHVNGGKLLEIMHPQFNVLAGTQPGFLSSLLPEEAWSMGFTSRIIMIYAGSGPKVSLFGQMDRRDELFQSLVRRVRHMATLMGCFTWEDAAAKELQDWHFEGCPPIPTHSKLVNYNPRRSLHMLKLSMISAVSRSGTTHIVLDDVLRARDWLLAAEQIMPDIFREMVHRSDAQVIQDLHFFMWQIYAVKKVPMHQGLLIHFLQNKVPTEKVMRVLDIAEKANIIARIAGTENMYIPRAQHEFGHQE
jgi:hypothetical protein